MTKNFPVVSQIIFPSSTGIPLSSLFANSNFIGTLDIFMSAIALAFARVHQLYGRERQREQANLVRICWLSGKSVFYHFLPRTSNQLTPLAARMQIISATDSIILRNLRQKILAASLALNVFNQQVNNAQAVHTRFTVSGRRRRYIICTRARSVLFCGA